MSTAPKNPQFPETRWSLVLSSLGDDSDGRRALEELCSDYWYPLYAFVRQLGKSPEEAQDLTQGFFEHLLRRDLVRRASREEGRLRSFLLVAMKNFVRSDWRKGQAVKRGGGVPNFSFDDAEQRYRSEPSAGGSPDEAFDRRWVSALLETVMQRLHESYRKRGKEKEYATLAPFIAGTESSSDYATMAEQLASTEGNVRTAMFRMRKRYREFLRREIAETVADENQIDSEINALFATFA